MRALQHTASDICMAETNRTQQVLRALDFVGLEPSGPPHPRTTSTPADVTLAWLLFPALSLAAPSCRLGVHKWSELGLAYPLEGVAPPSPSTVQGVVRQLEAAGIPVICGAKEAAAAAAAGREAGPAAAV